ncbi:MAG: carbon-nitrogen hydrolase family protein [Gemmatales bacterium]|nr:carbon-nitrogen hydrolase family protein [Gemmatales bacterium]MDW8385425.1 carbon-nitrogen hydrolase family protein [Gemmatales bacterium]
MPRPWKLAAVQMDCHLGDIPFNLHQMTARLREAANEGAKLVVFPECILCGYCFESRDEAFAHAEPVPGPSVEVLMLTCRELEIYTVYGLLERDGDRLFNTLALVGPEGLIASYRKIHLPFLGADRFTTPGDRPFAVHDLNGLKLGMNICYDGSFPESARVLTLLGADLIVLPTNWPPEARLNPLHVVLTRAFENRVYYAAVNRVGEERGVRFIGLSRIVAPDGTLLAVSESDQAEILFAEIDPTQARRKRIVHAAGKYELDRIADRRPEMYGPLLQREERA